MATAKGVTDILEAKIGFPKVMHGNAPVIRQDRLAGAYRFDATFRMHKQIGVIGGAGRMCPMEFSRGTHAGFIEMDDRRR